MGYFVIITFMNAITLKDIVYLVMFLLFQKFLNENVFAHKGSGTISREIEKKIIQHVILSCSFFCIIIQ